MAYWYTSQSKEVVEEIDGIYEMVIECHIEIDFCLINVLSIWICHLAMF